MGTWFNIQFLFGLYVYIRLLQLSIDRAGSQVQNEVLGFLKSTGTPLPKSVSVILETAPLEKRKNMIFFIFSRYRFKTRYIWMSESHLDQIRNGLQKLSCFLESPQSEYQEDRSKIRLALAELETLLRNMLPKDLVTRGENVSHLNNSKTVKLKKFKEIVPDDWLTYVY